MTRTSSKTDIAPALLLLAALALAGCSKLEELKRANTQPTQAATPAPAQAAATAPPAPAASPAAPAGPALATADGDMPGIRVEVQELKRTSGDTVSLKFAMINDSDKDLGFGYQFVEPNKGFGDVGGVNLIDPVAKKKYFVVRDTEGACVCSRDVPNIKPKSRANLWAKFPAPPEDVQKISVVIPHFTPLDDVPISR